MGGGALDVLDIRDAAPPPSEPLGDKGSTGDAVSTARCSAIVAPIHFAPFRGGSIAESDEEGEVVIIFVFLSFFNFFFFFLEWQVTI